MKMEELSEEEQKRQYRLRGQHDCLPEHAFEYAQQYVDSINNQAVPLPKLRQLSGYAQQTSFTERHLRTH